MSDSDKATWLIKSSGRILGPFTKNRIRDLLRDKEIVALDEISLPKKKWSYIRDQKDFQDVIEEMRVQHLKSGHDKTQTMGASFDEITGSVTEAILNQQLDELTSDVEPLNYDLTQDIPSLNDIDQIQQIQVRDVTRTSADESTTTTKHYGMHKEGAKNVTSFSQTLWRITLVVIFLSFVSLSVHKYFIKPQTQSQKNQNDISIANAFYTNGLYEQALVNYKKAFASGLDSKEPLLRYGTLLIQIERNTVEGVKMLEEALKFDPRNRVYVNAGIGLANIFDGDYIFAAKNLKDALDIEPNLTSAIVNLGWLRQREGALSDAIQLYSSAIIKGAGRVDNSPYIYLSKALVEKWKKTGDTKALNEAKNTLLSILDTKTDYKQEALFLLTYIYSQSAKTDEYFSTLERMLDTDPYLTGEHAHDLNIYHEGISWNSFIEMCEEIYRKNKEDASAVALSGYCSLRGGDLRKAEMRFSELANKRTQSPLLLGLHAYYHLQSSNDSHAAITLGKAIEMNKSGRQFSLPIILEARTCQELGDNECAIKKWKELLQKDEKNIQALSNIVILNIKKGSVQSLDSYVRDARSLSDNYAPARYAETYLYENRKK